MLSLFDNEARFPEGFQYYPDFLTDAEEAYLIRQIANTPLHNFTFHGYEAKRKVASFGYDWNFETRTLRRGNDIPEEFRGLLNKVSNHLSVSSDKFAEILLTEYPPEAVINWHRDAPPFDLIAGISLLADCIFRLRPYDKTKRSRSSIFPLTVKRRSLYVLQGVSRSDWEHSILPVKGTRYSVTLRTLKQG